MRLSEQVIKFLTFKNYTQTSTAPLSLLAIARANSKSRQSKRNPGPFFLSHAEKEIRFNAFFS